MILCWFISYRLFTDFSKLSAADIKDDKKKILNKFYEFRTTPIVSSLSELVSFSKSIDISWEPIFLKRAFIPLSIPHHHWVIFCAMRYGEFERFDKELVLLALLICHICLYLLSVGCTVLAAISFSLIIFMLCAIASSLKLSLPKQSIYSILKSFG